jgi:S-adenosylmethionine:tRNA ribosyltransferase-isomerase
VIAPASAPRPAAQVRLLTMDHGEARLSFARDLPQLLCPGDVVVVNDAATLPAAIPAILRGQPVELRLARMTEDPRRFEAIVLGPGHHRVRTEDRPPPPVNVGDELVAGHGLRARVTAISPRSPRLLEVVFASPGGAVEAFHAALHRAGKPVQYAHVPGRLALWDVQNVWASVPWALEAPSAGLPLRGETLLALRARGIAVVAIRHSAGLSSTGDAALDAQLPLPERWRVSRAVRDTLRAARARGGRVVAVGTSVVRALESAARAGGEEEGVTDLRIGADTELRLVDAIVTGVHEDGTSHFELLSAFASPATLRRWLAVSAAADLRSHELGDLWLLRAR